MVNDGKVQRRIDRKGTNARLGASLSGEKKQRPHRKARMRASVSVEDAVHETWRLSGTESPLRTTELKNGESKPNRRLGFPPLAAEPVTVSRQ
jgi:hypothetical protein